MGDFQGGAAPLIEHMRDSLLWEDWHPVFATARLKPGRAEHTTLLGQDIALWRSADSVAHAWEDSGPVSSGGGGNHP
jgi:phenylpropionate dioxygenase-like ring-hydroxylating dioxygenase large terminal subunit